MKKRIILSTILIPVFMISCKNKIPESFGWYDYERIPVVSMEKEKDFIKDKETIRIKTDFNVVMNSMIGRFFLKEDTLCFADEGATSIIQYDLSGKYLRNAVNKGRSRSEIINLVSASIDDSDNTVIMDGNWGITVFDKNWKRAGERILNLNYSKRSAEEAYKHPNPLIFDIYEIAYDYSKVELYDGRYAIFPITTEHDLYNGYEGKNVSHFFRNSRIFGICDLNGGTSDMFGNYSPWYYENCLPMYADVHFDVSGSDMYYSFGADSLIYIMDIPTRKIKMAFGVPGKGMNQDYKSYDTFKEVEHYYLKDRNEYGHYGDVSYEKESNLVFRTYYQGNDSPMEYLQIYQNYMLIGELAWCCNK